MSKSDFFRFSAFEQIDPQAKIRDIFPPFLGNNEETLFPNNKQTFCYTQQQKNPMLLAC